MTEWTALSNTDKHIRLFVTAPSTWDEAKQICQVNSAELLSINSDNENLQINGKNFLNLQISGKNFPIDF